MRKIIATIILLLLGFKIMGQIRVTANRDTVGANNLYELTISHPNSYTNNWENVQVSAEFKGPQNMHIDGFFFDEHRWKVRFAAPVIGNWNYSLSFTTPNAVYTASGKFTCIPSETKGFLRRHPNNPFRLIYPDGTLFNGLGIEDCVLDYNGNGSPLDDWGFGGEFRSGTYTGSRTDMRTYMTAYGNKGAGFNLFRWTTDNCSFKLYQAITPTSNIYLVNEGKYGDTLVNALKDNGLRIWLTFFGPPVFGNINGSTPLEEAAIKRYIKYVVARYGAYTDIWELFNESSASAYYYDAITAYIKSIDPYQRLISVSDERPQLDGIDINSPHWYEKESELESDERAWTMINSRKLYGKPIIFGEQGNSVQCWDPLSALRMRIRLWTSFFAEGILIFWNASWAKDYQHPVAANIYLGQTEEDYVRALHDYSAKADSSVKPFVISPLNSSNVRAYGLGGQQQVFGYFHHYNNHSEEVNTSFKYRMRKPGIIYWINPADNSVINSYPLKFGTQIITSPGFNIDLAMRIDFDQSNIPFDETEKLDLLLYPNPAKTEVAVNGNFNSTVLLSLFNINGKALLLNKPVNNDEHISVSGLANGVYIYHVQSGGRIMIGKLMIFK
jgi:hypothetical protein